jgi:P-type conjugative transfer protein TrbJ
MKHKYLYLLLAGLISCICLAQPAGAGGGGAMGTIVYDPTNHAETALTAANAVRQTAQMVQAYTLQIQQYLNELENLKRLPQETLDQVLSSYSNEIATAQSLSQTLGNTLGQINTLQDSFTAQFRQMAAMGLSPNQYMDREMQIAQFRGQSISSVYQNEVSIMQSVNDSYARIRMLQEQIPASSGLQQSFQTTNQHLNLLAGQNALLISLIAGHQANASAHLQDEAKANAMAGEIIQKRHQDEALKVQQLHQQLRDQESTMGWGIMSQGR